MLKLVEFQCPVCRNIFDDLCSNDDLPKCPQCKTQTTAANKTLNLKNNSSRVRINDRPGLMTEPGIQQYVGDERVM